MILDTNFVIDLLNGKEYAALKMQSFAKEDIECTVTTPTIFELWSGLVSLKKSDSEKHKIRSLIKNQIVYLLDEESAEVSGKIHGELENKGLTINPIDCMIAGIAIANNKKVLTRDEHFSRIEGLKVEGY